MAAYLIKENVEYITIHHAYNIRFYVRYYATTTTRRTTYFKKFATLPFQLQPWRLLTLHGSGSVFVESLGGIGGLLTGGPSGTSMLDITPR